MLKSNRGHFHIELEYRQFEAPLNMHDTIRMPSTVRKIILRIVNDGVLISFDFKGP